MEKYSSKKVLSVGVLDSSRLDKSPAPTNNSYTESREPISEACGKVNIELRALYNTVDATPDFFGQARFNVESLLVHREAAIVELTNIANGDERI